MIPVLNENDRLLIISNNPLSYTNNNGKTILSYIDCLPKENVYQLYFNGSLPKVSGYKYFQISDRDVIKGKFNSKKRGRAINLQLENCNDEKELVDESQSLKKYVKRNIYTNLIRELLWYKSWKSNDLIEWLNNVVPTAIFFVGGDTLFAYDICKFVADCYGCRLSLYITDDYVMNRANDTLLERAFRSKIKKSICNTLLKAVNFFTVSEIMQKEYLSVFNRESDVIVNMTESLLDKELNVENDRFEFIYTGSLYYGRDEVLGKIADSIERYNNISEKKAFLTVHANYEIDEEKAKVFVRKDACDCGKPLNKEELKKQLNSSDILVFVESFKEEQIEKTKYSLSTKVPEYLSLKKPILAVGPSGIGSINYLNDVSMTVTSLDDIDDCIYRLLSDNNLQDKLSSAAYEKYCNNNDKKRNQELFISKVIGH